MSVRLGRYFWKLFVVNAALMALVLAGSVWAIVSQLDQLRRDELSRHLYAQAAALKVAVGDRLHRSYGQELEVLAEEVGSTEQEGVRVTFVLTDGTVLGDSEAEAEKMESHADRPEIRQALAGGRGESVRWSHTVAKNMKYVAVRVGPPEDPRGVVRVSMAVESIAARAEPAQRLVIVIALIAVAAAVLLALALALLWSRRIRRITETARSISRGDLSARVDVVGHDEVATLGRSLNEMRQRFSAHLDTIDRHRRTLDSLVSQLREGVVVADADGRIVLINAEAVELLQLAPVPPESALVGRTIEQCVPQRKLQDMLHLDGEARKSEPRDMDAPGSEGAEDQTLTPLHEVELKLSTSTGDRAVLARAFDVRLPFSSRGDSARDASAHVGRALLLTDVTELTRVMHVKADLAANASHELRTPLSAIRAAVDTLRSIAWDADSEAASQFIDVVDRHSARMEAMIGDLLELSRLESGADRFVEKPISAREFLDEAHAANSQALSTKDLKWNVAISEGDVTLTTSPELLRMILRNLIDNAIRFTDRGGHIELSVTSDGQAVVFEVADTGCGIAPEDQQRVFERFFQVERARSGSERGTGLGLSIVRHAVAAMKGHIKLDSALGQGTRVTVRVPHWA